MRGQQSGRLDQPIGPAAVLEADVVANGDAVDSGVHDARGERPEAPSMAFDVLLPQDDAERNAHGQNLYQFIAMRLAAGFRLCKARRRPSLTRFAAY
jgi:hypothetical protein